jgi:hypothetical protein
MYQYFMANLISQVLYMPQRTKYNNMEPDAVDFFGECMNSPRNGRTPLANEIYVSYMYYTQVNAWFNTFVWPCY